MKIYKAKDGTIYIVAGKNEKEPQVCIVKDDGNNARSIFGEQLGRFAFHYASVWGNTQYTSRTNHLIDEEKEAYQYKLVRIKKIKRLRRKLGTYERRVRGR